MTTPNTPTIPVPRSFFGHYTLTAPGLPGGVDRFPALPVGCLGKGTITDWPYIERTAGVYTWTDLDYWTTYVRSKGQKLFYCLQSFPDFRSAVHGTFTVTIASPGVVTMNAHGLQNGQSVLPSTTGALPTGLNTSTRYFVINATANTFQLSLTEGGAAINTTGTQSGTHSLKISVLRAIAGVYSSVDDLTAWSTYQDYITALCTRYASDSGIEGIQLGNEPYNTVVSFGALAPATLAKMCFYAIPIVRSLCPHWKIIAPDLDGHTSLTTAGGYYDQWMTALASLLGGSVPAGYFDVIAVHGYPSPSNCIPEAGDINYSGTYAQHAMHEMVAWAAKYSCFDNVDWWDVEGSWGLEGGGNVPTDEDDQAAFVCRWLLLRWSNGCKRAYWYAWPGPSDGGNLWGGLKARKAASAFQRTYEWMIGATMTAYCQNVTGNRWACTFTRAGGYSAEVAWNTGGADATYTPPVGTVQYRDLGGVIYPYTSGTVTIGTKPMIFENSTTLGLPKVRL